VLAADRRDLQPALKLLAETIAGEVRERQSALSEAFAQSSLPARGESFDALGHYLYAATVRLARETLEADGTLPAWPTHADGPRWVWWAEEPLAIDRE
jgi:hypothetical protein